MMENLNATKGLIFSGQLLLALTNKGLSRETAYDLVQRNAMRVWDEDRDFRELVKADEEIKSHLSAEDVDRTFSLDHYLRNVFDLRQSVRMRFSHKEHKSFCAFSWLYFGIENFSAKFPITGSLKYCF